MLLLMSDIPLASYLLIYFEMAAAMLQMANTNLLHRYQRKTRLGAQAYER